MKEITPSKRAACFYTAVATASLVLSSVAHGSTAIVNIQLVSDQVGTLVTFDVDNETNIVQLQNTFAALEPISLRFTVGHAASGGNQYTVLERITNNSRVNWTDYQVAIESALDSVVFSKINQTTLFGFELDSPPSSGPHNLNYTGSLTVGEVTGAEYFLELSDPGIGNSYTFDLVQTPTTSAVPVPGAAWLLGSALFALVRRKQFSVR